MTQDATRMARLRFKRTRLAYLLGLVRQGLYGRKDLDRHRKEISALRGQIRRLERRC